MRPDTPATHTADAERLERAAEQYPEDREQLLLQAAAHRELSGDRERATALYDGLLAGGPQRPHLIKALKAANLWEYGHAAEARAIIDGIRGAEPREAAPWEIVAETLESHDELTLAQECFTRGAELLIDEENVPYEAVSLLVGRHRVRRLQGEGHDDWDVLADRLHRSPVSLDELHDPKRLWALGSSDPADLRAEISRLRAELGTYRAALSRPFPVAVLHWPAAEFTELLAAYPALGEEYTDHAIHLAAVEQALRELVATGTTNVGTVAGSLPSYEAFAASESASPDDPALLPQYATVLAARGRALPWPPERNAACWCGSGEQYRECHGAA
ncbi:SEC-C metal-binding domain-containing protein [Streptomyces sp. NPDC060194]|uniref:SEC-C metal-binding domain-containing protein n=1 Tax=Streptomyces sp. NPDC060194 TaxID=3347069 RepID=UPI003653620E